MKKMILVILAIMFVASIAWSDGTVRIYTGNGEWHFSDWPVPTLHPAVTVAQYDLDPGPASPWDPADSTISPPRPWRKLFEQSPRADGYWISWNTAGRDTVPPDYLETLWFYSPTFALIPDISRATIWLSADDIIDVALLRDLDTDETYAIPCVPVNSFTNFVRFDLTDFFRSFGNNLPNCRMEFRVRNTMPHFIGMIAYMSYDYGESRNYTYYLSGSGWRYVSMPFKPTDPDATLGSLFPGIVLGLYYNWQTGTWQFLSATSPLVGSLGDITRTYTFRIYYPTGGSHYTTIPGYPIFEQRYLDITTNNYLYFGTITCDCPPGQTGYVPFSGSNPDDIWYDKITGTTNWSYQNPSGDTWGTPISEVRAKKAYYVVPHTSCPDCDDPCLPYHLDIINYRCSYPHMSSSDEEYYSMSEDFIIDPAEEYTFFEFTDEDLALIRWIEDSVAPYIHIPDSAEICARFPDLCEDIGFHKSVQQQVQKPSLSVSVYPSPFNSELTISVYIPNDDYLTIGIYDISGDLVRTLYTAEVQMGEQSFKWNGLDDSGNQLPSGNYLVRVATNAETAIVRTVMIK